MSDILTRALFNSLISGTGGIAVHSYGIYPTAAAGTTLTGGAADTYGVWAQIIAAASVTADIWITHIEINTGNTATNYIVQIGTGASASETGRIALPYMRQAVTAAGNVPSVLIPLPFPLRVPASTRIAGRVQDTAGSSTIVVHVVYCTGLLA